MGRTIRWGVLGASKFARDKMGPAIHAARDSVLAALSTSDPAKAEPFARLAPGLKVHDSYDALLADPDIDAVYIPLPNHLHVEWALKAIEAGKHVLCEKPIAMRESEFDALIAARNRSGLMLAEAFMIVHHPQWQRARDLLAEGAIGRLMHVDARFSFDNPDPANIRNKPETGGGSLHDIGVYTFGSTRFATGKEPQRILHAGITRENGVEVTTHLAAQFDGFTYSSLTSMRMHSRQEVVFHGAEGVLRMVTPFNANVFGEARLRMERGFDVTEQRWPGVNHYVLQVENFTAAMAGAPYPCPLEFSRGTQAMIDAVLAAEG